MKLIGKSIISAVSAMVLIMCASSTMADTVLSTTTFGSLADGYGGFNAEVTTPLTGLPAPAWTLETTGVRMSNAPTNDSGQVNSTLLNEFILTQTAGYSYQITGVMDWISTYAADNNRAGILLFANSNDLAGADSGLSLQYNLGNGQIRILAGGVNGATEDASNVAYGGLSGSNAIGTTFTFVADVAFDGLNIDVDFTLIDENDYSQTTSASVVAADYLGPYFGFGTRGRIRNTSPGVNDFPFIYEANSFEIIETVPVPEPSSLALLGLGGLMLLNWRRRA